MLSLLASPRLTALSLTRSASTVSVVLKTDLPPRGYVGDTVTVKAGYMRNKLYPGKMAVYATPDNVLKYGKVVDGTVETEEAIALKAAAAEEEESATKLDPALYELQRYLNPRTVIVKRSVDPITLKILKGPATVPPVVFKAKLLKQHKVELEEDEDVRMPVIDGVGEYLARVLLKGGECEVKVRVVAR